MTTLTQLIDLPVPLLVRRLGKSHHSKVAYAMCL